MPSENRDNEGSEGTADLAALSKVEQALESRWPESKLEPSLDRVRALTDLLGSPQRAYPVIHLTGTNGKSSTARMADALLRALDLRTGRYTSPHLHSVTERICLDGEPVSPGRFVEVYEEVAPYLGMVDDSQPLRLSYFEALTGMAFAAFADAPVDVAVVEVGMGGVWDATNVADAQVAVVTPISVDHSQYLGDTVEAVAGEKAGIIKPDAFAVIAQQPVEAAETLLRQAAMVEATVAREGLEFGVLAREVAVDGQLVSLRGLSRDYENVFLPLHGAYQAHNAACALAAVEAFVGQGRQELDVELVRAGFAAVRSPGRLEVVRRSPTVLLDTAHNPAGAQALAEAVTEAFTFTRLVGVVGVLADKDALGILEALEPVLAEVVVTVSSSPRSLPAAELEEIASGVFGSERVRLAESLVDALDAGIGAAEVQGELSGAGVLVTGSTTTVADVRRLLGRG